MSGQAHTRVPFGPEQRQTQALRGLDDVTMKPVSEGAQTDRHRDPPRLLDPERVSGHTITLARCPLRLRRYADR
jgi:hypothetical protein